MVIFIHPVFLNLGQLTFIQFTFSILTKANHLQYVTSTNQDWLNNKSEMKKSWKKNGWVVFSLVFWYSSLVSESLIAVNKKVPLNYVKD